LLLVVLIIITLSTPSVQTILANKVTKKVNEDFGTEIHIDRLGLNWKGEVDIREVYIEDHHSDTLIYAKALQTNILSIKNLIEGDLDFGHIDLTQAKFYYKVYKGEDNDNISIFADKFNSDNPSKKSSKPFELVANNVELTNSKVKIIDENLENIELFNLKDINIKSKNLIIIGPNVSTEIKSLSLKAKRGFEIRNLSSDFSYTQESLDLIKLSLLTEQSTINGEIKLSYDQEKGMSDFANNVVMAAQLKNTQVSTNDINAFYNEFVNDQLIEVNGDINGILNDFTFNEAHLNSKGISLVGDFIFKDLLKKEEDFIIQANGHTIKTNSNALRKFMPRVIGDALPKEIFYLGEIKFKGNTTITKATFSTNSTLSSTLGYVKTNINITDIDNSEKASYVGDILLTNFNLGLLTKSNSLGTVTSDLHIEGVGFTRESLNTKITGTITSFIFEEYDYKNITLTGNLEYPLFDGELTINDPNVKLDFKGLIDVSKELNQFDFEADVQFAELHQLNLVKRDSISVFAGKIVMEMEGNSLDNTQGSISFNQTFYQNEKSDYYFDDFNITTQNEGLKRSIEINSPDIITGNITGEFILKDIPKLFINGIGSNYTNYIPKEVSSDQYIDYNFQIHNKIIDVFVPEILFGDNTRIKGSVYSDDSKFNLNFRSPEILLYDNYLGKVNLQVDNNNPLFNTYISIDSLYNGFYNLKDVNFINKTLNDTLYIQTTFSGGKRKEDLYDLALYHTIDSEGNSVLGVKKSSITYKENVWHLNEKNNNQNKIIFDNEFKDIQFDSIVLNHNDEYIQFAGSVTDSTHKNLQVQFKDVNIGNIIPHVDSLNLRGNINGELSVIQKDGAYFPISSILIDHISVNDVDYGNLDLKFQGNKSLTYYDIIATLTNENIKSIDAVGNIDVSPKAPIIQLNVELNDLNLMAISPFGGGIISDIRGLISGSTQITGNLKSPDILGNFVLKNAGLGVPYLDIDFDLDDRTNLIATKDKIEIKSTQITDTKHNTIGMLSGNASHTNFEKWKLALHITTDNLVVLDTKPEEDKLFYGTAFISGEADITGPIDELVIDVIATTEKNTSFKIPLSDTESIGDDSFIRFLSPKEKEARLRGEKIITEDLTGLTLNFELDINRNAEVEIVIDPVTKSAIRGRGAGTLLLEINTLGKFNMWGDFIVYEGFYDFRYGKIIKKEIEVERDGTITWDGIPDKAELNLKAIYKTRANPSALLDDPTINRKIPVEVYIDLNEDISQPELTFDIAFPEVSSTVRSELEYKLQTQEDREKQALFLITTDAFISDAAGQNAISGTLTGGINALLAEMLADEDALISISPYYDFGIDTVELETEDEIGVQFSSQLSERIIVNGKVGIPVGGINDSRVAGDVEVQWLVNEDGSLRVKFFNRQAELQFIGEDQTFEQGIGISYSVDFDTLRELIKKIFGTEIELESASNEVVPDDSEPVLFKSKTKIEEN